MLNFDRVGLHLMNRLFYALKQYFEIFFRYPNYDTL